MIIQRRKSGQAVVEYSLLIPIFLLVFFGIVEFGIIFHCWITLSAQCSAAAKVGSKRISLIAGRDSFTAYTHSTQAQVAAAFMSLQSNFMPTTSYKNIQYTGVEVATTTVTVSADFQMGTWSPFSYLLSGGSGTLLLHAAATERKE
ncbi:MAG: pilus assembly protein [Candidatus Riflebacteria bacterium]|nr:pilus assembly protein [Candidatus Riflebacteria bacterium]